jgi:hypothetical protein
MKLLDGMLEVGCEGNISWFENRQEKLTELITELKPKNLLQIGFNVGHSALLICNLIKNLKLVDKDYSSKEVNFKIFDICVCEATIPNFEFLKKEFKDFITLELIVGDSLQTVPNFLEKNKIYFDFIEIDGCHTFDCVVKDITNTIDSLSADGIIYVDDYKSGFYSVNQVDNGVDSVDWKNYTTDFVDGVFWAKKKKLQSEVVSHPKNFIELDNFDEKKKEMVNHPNHYGGESNPYEAIKVIDAWDLDFCLGNTVKYISRAGKKHPDKELEDLKKALWYLQHKIDTLEKR